MAPPQVRELLLLSPAKWSEEPEQLAADAVPVHPPARTATQVPSCVDCCGHGVGPEVEELIKELTVKLMEAASVLTIKDPGHESMA